MGRRNAPQPSQAGNGASHASGLTASKATTFRAGTVLQGKRKEASDDFSDALQREGSATPKSWSSSRIAVGPPSSPGKPREGTTIVVSARSPSTVKEKPESLADEENTPRDREEEPEAKGNIYGVFVQSQRCEELCHRLGLTLREIRKMKRKYDANDMYHTYVWEAVLSNCLFWLAHSWRCLHSGEITQAEFFYIIREERRPLTVGILAFAGVPEDIKYLSFDQYLMCIVSFATLTKPELFQYIFDLYDSDKSGSLDEKEFAKMNRELQSPQFSFPKNVDMAIRSLEGRDSRGVRCTNLDGLVDFNQFLMFARNFPVAFFPILNMQKNVRDATLGEDFWSRVVSRKLKAQELLTYMRRNNGAMPDLTFKERLSTFFSNDVAIIRRRASELYALEMVRRRNVGSG